MASSRPFMCSTAMVRLHQGHACDTYKWYLCPRKGRREEGKGGDKRFILGELWLGELEWGGRVGVRASGLELR